MSLEAAIRDASLDPAALDERGLLPVAQARALLAATDAVDRDNLDQVWLALLSLDDGAELARAAAHLRWNHPPRGKANLALVERYGDGALAWLATRQEHGVLIDHPWCVLPSLHALATPGALALLLSVDGVLVDAGSMTAWVYERAPVPEEGAELAEAALAQVIAWSRRHLAIALPVLASAAEHNPRAADALRALARQDPGAVGAGLRAAGAERLIAQLDLTTGLDVDTVVAELAEASLGSWPVFHTGVDGRLEYFGLRAIGARARSGDGWAIVFERLQGSDPDMFMVARYAYGPAAEGGFDYEHSDQLSFEFEGDGDEPVFGGTTVVGPVGPMRIDESVFARFDLRPEGMTEHGSWAARAVAIRAYLEAHPGACWPPVEDALAATGLADAEVIVVSTSYQHPAPWSGDGDPPWPTAVDAAPAIRSLVDAVLSGDASRFAPGPSNLDWRIHATCPSAMPAPWTTHPFDVDGAWVAAAMRVAAVAADDRGLMPLAEARAVVAAADALARGDGRAVGEAWVWDGDRTWAALLSLADGDEAAAALQRLPRRDGPRDAADNRALVERYGDDAAAIVRAQARADGVVVGEPLLRATVMALGTAAGFRLVWDLTGWDEPGATGTPDEQAGALFAAWVAAHPAVGFVELGRLVATGDAAAGSFLTTWAAPQVRRVFGWLRDGLGEATAEEIFARLGMSSRLAPAHVLAALDHAAARGGDAWPTFVTGVGPSREYHGLRLLGARVGDGWVVVLERFEGYGPRLRVARYAYGDGVVEGLGTARAVELPEDLAVDDADTRMIEPPDYWTRVERPQRRIAAARAYLAATPSAVWAPAAEVLAAVGITAAEVIVDTVAFAHAPTPSQSPTYQTLAEALVAREPSRFAPGASNLAVALYVTGPVVPAPAPVDDADAQNEEPEELDDDDDDAT